MAIAGPSAPLPPAPSADGDAAQRKFAAAGRRQINLVMAESFIIMLGVRTGCANKPAPAAATRPADSALKYGLCLAAATARWEESEEQGHSSEHPWRRTRHTHRPPASASVREDAWRFEARTRYRPEAR